MCSMNNQTNWVTFEDEGSASTSPSFASTPLKIPSSGTKLASTPLKSPGAKAASPPLFACTPVKTPPGSVKTTGLKTVPRPNGLKLVLPPLGDTSWSFRSSLESSSPPMHFNLNEISPVPCNTPLCTPVREVPPTGALPFHCRPWDQHSLFHSFSSSSAALLCSSSSGPDQASMTSTTPQPKDNVSVSDGPSSFPSFQGHPGHFNPFWDGAGEHGVDSGSSSSDSESGGSSLPRFFIRTKDGNEPPRPDHLQSSYSYICHKLEGLRAEENLDTEEEGGIVVGRAKRRGVRDEECAREGPSQAFVSHGLFRTEKRDGWSLMLRIPEKKNRMSSRQWGPIYLRLIPGGVLQMYYEKGLEKPFKEFQLEPHCRLSDLKLENCGESRKIQTVKVEYVSYTEKKRYHPKLEVSHEAEVEQLLKFGTMEQGDMEDLLETIEEELLRLAPPLSQKRHYEEQEMTLQITDHLCVQLDKDGVVMDRAAVTKIHCLAFLNGPGECFLALNDLGLLRFDASYSSGSEEDDILEGWMEIGDCYFHKCVNDLEFYRSRLLKFCPPDACRVELMRYKTVALGCTDLPFTVKAVVTVQGAYVELQAFIRMSAAFSSFTGMSETQPLCDNILIRVPVPGDWVKVSRTVTLLRRKSLTARMNRNACLGSVSAAESQPIMQVTVGTVKYENVYSAIVWRIDRLPAKNMAVDHPHSFSCKLELGSDQEIPIDWYPFVTVEYEMAGAVVSQTRVKSLGTESDVQPQKNVAYRTHCLCQSKLYLSVIEDVIENMRELILDEGLEDRVLEVLKQLWESKVMQSNAVDGLALVKNTINSSNFVLQLPPNYGQNFTKPTASMVNPAGQNVQSFTTKNNGGTLATFSLPPGVTYPVQIPAGVTLQTASGQLYKVNVPVMVTQAPAGQCPLPPSQLQPRQRVPVVERRDLCSTSLQPAPVVPSTVPKTMAPLKTEPFTPRPVACPNAVPQTTEQKPLIPLVPLRDEKPVVPQPAVQPTVQGNHVLQSEAPPVQAPFSLHTQMSFQPPYQPPLYKSESPFDSGHFTLDGIDFDSPKPIDMSLTSASTQMQSLQVKMETVLPDGSAFGASKVAAEETVRQEGHGGTADMSTHLEGLPLDASKLEMALLKDYNYNDALADIIQLDGPSDSSSDVEEFEEEMGGAIGENDFLGMMTAEALQALQEAEESSDDGKSSSGDDSVGMDEVTVEEDPLNSGDDVSEQDVPDLFDTNNVIVCQYDKIHRSKNRWKFYLKDGVMCYGGKDYVFSKAVGEAEW
ncbi:stonin-1 [Esox lucius]|uniref:stonin-1 n=1 Tax=Esox lucius TaxID=8010 RepID=UPI001476C228|nr:stonin-1 [Esox lucius]